MKLDGCSARAESSSPLSAQTRYALGLLVLVIQYVGARLDFAALNFFT